MIERTRFWELVDALDGTMPATRETVENQLGIAFVPQSRNPREARYLEWKEPASSGLRQVTMDTGLGIVTVELATEVDEKDVVARLPVGISEHSPGPEARRWIAQRAWGTLGFLFSRAPESFLRVYAIILHPGDKVALGGPPHP